MSAKSIIHSCIYTHSVYTSIHVHNMMYNYVYAIIEVIISLLQCLHMLAL